MRELRRKNTEPRGATAQRLEERLQPAVRSLLESPVAKRLRSRRNFMVAIFAGVELCRLLGRRGRSWSSDELIRSATSLARATDARTNIDIDSERVSKSIATRLAKGFSSLVAE